MPRNPDKVDYSGNFPKELSYFNELVDPRSSGYTKHHFGEVIFIAFVSIICGIKSYELMEEFGDTNEEWFRKWISLPNGVPCFNTFSRILEALCPKQFSSCIAHHLEETVGALEFDQIAIDGKALRGSATKTSSHLHMVSAWACDRGLTLGQKSVDEKSNEITAIPELLEALNLKGSVVTIDAMGTQKAIAEQIIEQEGEYILSVKANQKSLLKELRDYFVSIAQQKSTIDQESWESHGSKERNRSRMEHRKTIVCNNLSWMSVEIREQWKGMKSVVLVERKRKDLDNNWTLESHFYISSLEAPNAEKMAHYIRSHWSIENTCHWTLDVTFQEDKSKVRQENATQNLSALRRIALNALREAKDFGRRKKPSSIAKKQLRASHSHSYREHVLSLV